MPKRHWNKWSKKFGEEIAHITNRLGLLAIGGGSIGTYLATSQPIVGLLVGGGLFVTGVSIAAVRAIPPKLTDPKLVYGESFKNLLELPEFTEEVPSIGVVGVSNAGKSTLINLMAGGDGQVEPTIEYRATVLRTNGVNPRHFVLLDGRGEDLTQQFAICEEASALFFVLDHNRKDDTAAVLEDRKSEQNRFVDSVVPFLARNPKHHKFIYVLLNKRDNWERSTAKAAFESWGESVATRLRSDADANVLNTRPHSNFRSEDLNLVWNEIESINL